MVKGDLKIKWLNVNRRYGGGVKGELEERRRRTKRRLKSEMFEGE
jgi:hypothetical protein